MISIKKGSPIFLILNEPDNPLEHAGTIDNANVALTREHHAR